MELTAKVKIVKIRYTVKLRWAMLQIIHGCTSWSIQSFASYVMGSRKHCRDVQSTQFLRTDLLNTYNESKQSA